MIEHAESAEPSLPRNPYGVSRRDLLAAGTALGAAAALGETTRASAVTIISDRSYEAYNDPTKPLKNPERGIYASTQPKVATDYHTLVVKYLELQDQCANELVWMGKDNTNTTEELRKYATFLDECRQAGTKAVFRPRYDTAQATPNKCGVLHAKDLDLQLRHIGVIGQMLRENRDAIAVIQAGYLGRWGEWNAGSISTAPLLYNYNDRIAITKRILSAYSGGSSNRLLQPVEFRTPVFAQEILDLDARANVGLHNDCFMSSVDEKTKNLMTTEPTLTGATVQQICQKSPVSCQMSIQCVSSTIGFSVQKKSR
jgi:hypothetical protein